jgi:hypothetical protein
VKTGAFFIPTNRSIPCFQGFLFELAKDISKNQLHLFLNMLGSTIIIAHY